MDLLKHVKAYLIGPRNENEVIDDRPNEHYVLGLLFPAGSESLDQDDFDTPDSVGGDSRHGGHVSDTGRGSDDAVERDQSPYWLPSSIGILCCTANGVNGIAATVNFATYERSDSGWMRIPVSHTFELNTAGESVITDRNGNALAKVTWNSANNESSSRGTTLSVFLSNAMDEYSGRGRGSRDERCARILFQASIRLDGKKGSFIDTGATVDRRLLMPDEVPLEMLYRERKVYARGYGCSADWDKNDSPPRSVFTEAVPHYQSKRIDYMSNESGTLPWPIDMVDIDEAESPQALYDLLQDVPKKYTKWIQDEESKVRGIESSEFRAVVVENARQAVIARDRMMDGLEMLRDPDNRDVYDAFKAANHAMLLQRIRYARAAERSKTGRVMAESLDTTIKGKNVWRPFQMAFLLMNLRAMADPESDRGRTDRAVADLLWLPTGGGKTEAYSALAAFTMVLRRLRRSNNNGAGVSVIMRYTLRLLTVQQFERAATLICALEYMRRLDPKTLGDEPFLIGLWVGSGLTPNDPKRSAASLDRSGNNENTGSPSQLVFCPWCGQKMSKSNYCVDKKTEWTIARCFDPGCDFYSKDPADIKRALPILTVDLDIYRRCPSMIVATVDKFARMPWKPETSSLFGIVERRCDRHGYLTRDSDHKETRHNESSGGGAVLPVERLDPPDLIIQDELHLITGPLGTMVGLYETAVDYLCSFKAASGRHPKIVASTATIKGAESQMSRLFNVTDTCVFPSPVASPDNMFFWWESNKDGRLYVGVSFSHRSAKFALARLCAALLQRAYEIKSGGGDFTAVEPYWTLVSYFNSIRELGGATRLAEDDIVENIRMLSKLAAVTDPRKISDPVEITSNISGHQIRDIRRRLELDSTSDESIDVVLATNMISVGIDVNRLGLMTVVGQPKSVSEYIQATGRIGRREGVGGAIFTLFNPHKPRDLSQYEDFVGYHSRLQQAVEPAALTPFSDPAINRAIHAVLIAMIRLAIPGMSRNCDAEKLAQYMEKIKTIKASIVDRFASVENVDRDGLKCAGLMSMLDRLTDNWHIHVERAHAESDHVCYSEGGQGEYGGAKKNRFVLMRDFAAGGQDDGDFPRPTPGSLRDVEAMAGLSYDRVAGGSK